MIETDVEIWGKRTNHCGFLITESLEEGLEMIIGCNILRKLKENAKV